ncbi:MAG: response regulator [Bacteroidales bacterium]|nr:response regulator [Bacteroidales bacterium]MCF8454590.1 response regulator [Bacteroidales bacterium]
MIKPKNILVVEEDKLLACIFKMYIQNLGHNLVGIASSANESIEKCRELAPDLVLMDINLNGEMEGIHATKIIHKTSNTPIIYVTGETSESTLERALDTNIYGYLVKPITKEPLQENIQYAIKKHGQFQQLNLGDKRILTLISGSTTPILLIHDELVRLINQAAVRLFKIIHLHQIVDHPVIGLIEEKSRADFQDYLQKANYGETNFTDIYLNCVDSNLAIFPVKICGHDLKFDNQKTLQLTFNRLE